MGNANIQVFKSHSLFLKFYSFLRKTDMPKSCFLIL